MHAIPLIYKNPLLSKIKLGNANGALTREGGKCSLTSCGQTR